MAVGQNGWFHKELTARMILFITLFHGLHIGIFVFGWSVLLSNRIVCIADVPQVEASSRPSVSRAEYPHLLCMAFERRGPQSSCRWHLDRAAYVQEHINLDKTKGQVASIG